MKKMTVIVFLLLSVSILFPASARDIELAERAYQVGRRSMEANDFARAKRFLEYAVKKNPEHRFAFARLVVVLEKLNDFQTLVQYYEPYAKRNLNNETILFNMGVFALKAKKFTLSIEYLIKVKEKNPDNVKALYNLSLAYLEIKNYQESIKYSTICVAKNHNKKDALKNLVSAHLELKLYDAAQLYANELVKQTNWTDAFAIESLARTHAAKKEYAKAIELIKKAIALQNVALFRIQLAQYEKELKTQQQAQQPVQQTQNQQPAQRN